MKIVIAGGTGFIGSRLVWALAEAGHDCTVLIRTSYSSPESFPPNVRMAPYSDLPDAAEAVINLAGETIGGRWTRQKMARIVDSRVDITRLLVKWMSGLSTPPSVFLSGSAVGFYGDRGDEPLVEDSGPDPKRSFLCLLCLSWESVANEARRAGTRVVNLRTGHVLDPSGGMLEQMGAKLKRMPVIFPHARTEQLPWISLADTVGIIRFALENDSVFGPVNLAAPTLATWDQFYTGLGTILGKKVSGEMPRWMLRLALGKFSEVLYESQRVIPEKVVHQGYVFQDSELEEYLSGLRKADRGKAE
jgi:uncharacterized protein (TIGR01777 family)